MTGGIAVDSTTGDSISYLISALIFIKLIIIIIIMWLVYNWIPFLFINPFNH